MGGGLAPSGTSGSSPPSGLPWLPVPLELEAVLLLSPKQDKWCHQEVNKYAFGEFLYFTTTEGSSKKKIQATHANPLQPLKKDLKNTKGLLLHHFHASMMGRILLHRSLFNLNLITLSLPLS